MAITKREQTFIETIFAAAEAANQPLSEEDRGNTILAVQALLPLWDMILPLLVADVMRVIKENTHE